MHSSWSLLPFLFLSASVLVSAANDPPFDCRWSQGDKKWDLTSLGEETIVRTRVTPPSTTLESLRLDLCKDLTQLKDVAERDQCPAGTRACWTTTNKKEEEKDRILHVIPVGLSSVAPELKPLAAASEAGKGLSITLRGAKYEDAEQSVHISLLCATTVVAPKITSYDGKVVNVEWSAPAGCSFEGEPTPSTPPKGDEDVPGDEKSVGSGIGWFFLVLLLAFLAYFGLGAYYNYSTYGATGLDLIPHRDFWKEVPYMLKDVVSHLCSAVRPRRQNRTGYMAV